MSDGDTIRQKVVAEANPLIGLIKRGKISTREQLKSAYRTLLIKSHPDAVGSDMLLEWHLSLSSHYEEASLSLQENEVGQSLRVEPDSVNDRLSYYQTLQKIERVDKPYSFHRAQNLPYIMQLKAKARFHFDRWSTIDQRLYIEADRDYDRLKTEKPSGPYMKNALAINVSPVFHNIISYHLTGVGFYKTQVKQNLKAVLVKLAEHDCLAIKAFIELLIDDMKNGPALFGETKTSNRRKLPLSRGGV